MNRSDYIEIILKKLAGAEATFVSPDETDGSPEPAHSPDMAPTRASLSTISWTVPDSTIESSVCAALPPLFFCIGVATAVVVFLLLQAGVSSILQI